MSYCLKCGQEIPIEANFCPRCGTKTIKNGETNVPSKSDDIREVFNRIEQEFEKVLAIAAKEMQAAFNASKRKRSTVLAQRTSCMFRLGIKECQRPHFLSQMRPKNARLGYKQE